MAQHRRIASRSPGALGALCFSLCLLLWSAAASQAASIVEVTGFGSNPGRLKMFKRAPAGSNPAPLVVVLHGCKQEARGYANNAGWVQLAEQLGLALVLPEQSTSNNVNNCFNWFEPTHNARDRGEALSIKQMIDKMRASHAIDPKRVFVTGLSAGGAMTAVMLATYPEVFAAGGVIAGLPYGCADTVLDAFQCMSMAHPGSVPSLLPGTCLFFPIACLPGTGNLGNGPASPKQWGDLVRKASSHSGPFPRLSIWHGTADTTVVPANATALVAQWTDLHGLPQKPSVKDTVKGQQHQAFKAASGQAMVELYLIASMPHGAPVDPGSGPEQCGKAADFILDANICSSLFLTRFWGLGG